MEALVRNSFNKVFHNKTVLVTGHTGFKGSWLSCWLDLLGAKVIGLSNSDNHTTPNHFGLLGDSCSTNLIGDIRNREFVYETLEKYKPDFIFHLAAQPLVTTSIINPYETFTTNFVGTLNLLDSVRELKREVTVVNVTSDKCYQNNEWPWRYRESDNLGGKDPYSASKGCVEILGNAFNQIYFGENSGISYSSARGGNCIGGGDWAYGRIIPDLVKCANNKIPTEIRNPKATRPWQHVLECLSGYLRLAQQLRQSKQKYSGNWNFGPSDHDNVDVSTIVQISQSYWSEINTFSKPKVQSDTQEAMLLNLDSSKANILLKWKTVWPIEIAVKHTVNWYKHYYQENKVCTVSDIFSYTKTAYDNGLSWTISEGKQ